jgi:hypothetical protein
LPATNAKRLRTGANATKQSIFADAAMDCFAPLAMTRKERIASWSLSSGAHSRDSLAGNDDDGQDCFPEPVIVAQFTTR